MHLSARATITASIVLAASCSFSQQSEQSGGPQPDQQDHHVMAKISYSSGVASDRSVRQICFSVSHDGEYRMLASFSNGGIEVAHGTLAKEKFHELAKLISAPGFRKLTTNEPGLIRGDAEAFAAEIPLAGANDNEASELHQQDAWRLRWLNPDGERPFPLPVSNVVDWVRHFQPKLAQVDSDYTEYADVCPALGFRLLQPSLAER
jgi:hypothetical protein